MDILPRFIPIGKSEYSLEEVMKGQILAITLLSGKELDQEQKKTWQGYSAEFRNYCGNFAREALTENFEARMNHFERTVNQND